MSAKILVQQLFASYGNQTVLYDFNATFMPGTITALLGPSGCGKSTLLHCLNGVFFDIPGSHLTGTIEIDGKNQSDFSKEALRQTVGLVSQKPTPFPMSIYKNMTYAPIYYGERNKERLMEQTIFHLKQTGLYEEVSHKLHQSALSLSGGQKQRLCIARALTAKPKVLLLDEPCSALDTENAKRIEDLLIQLKTDYTIIMVTHDEASANRIADQIITVHPLRFL